jgi:hypothetical protein
MAPRLGFGTLLKMGDGGSPQTFAKIGRIYSGPNRSISVNEIETTNHDSDSYNGLPIQDFIGGAVNFGEVTFSVYYDPNDPTHDRSTGILGAIGLTKSFQLEEAGNPKGYEFLALVRDANQTFDPAVPMSMEITIRVKSDLTPYNITP